MSKFKDGALWMAERLRDHVPIDELKAASRELEAMETEATCVGGVPGSVLFDFWPEQAAVPKKGDPFPACEDDPQNADQPVVELDDE